jgi:hypothetical protein
MRRFIRLVLATALLASAPVVAGPGVLKDWGLSPSSNESVLVMRVKTYGFPYGFSFSKNGNSGFLSRVYLVDIEPGSGYRFVGRKLKPGNYRLDSVYQQGGWLSCFAEKTVSFDIKPGRIYYLGTFNSDEVLEDLQAGAVARGRTKLVGGEIATGWQPSVAPQWRVADDGELGSVKAFVAATMPKTSAEVELLPGNTASFSASKVEKLIQVCG